MDKRKTKKPVYLSITLFCFLSSLGSFFFYLSSRRSPEFDSQRRGKMQAYAPLSANDMPETTMACKVEVLILVLRV